MQSIHPLKLHSNNNTAKPSTHKQREMSQTLKSNKRQRTTVNTKTFLEKITLRPDPQTGLIAFEHFQTIYSKFQIAYIPSVDKKLCSLNGNSNFKLQDFLDVFNKLIPEDKDTWTEETWDVPRKETNGLECRNPGAFLDTKAIISSVNCHPRRGYCSFIVQNDKEQLERLLGELPIVHLPVLLDPEEASVGKENIGMTMKQQLVPMNYGPGLWIFFGWNIGENESDLQGRKEHTDAIHHDGTFHYQMSGVKDWHVRPTNELLFKRIDVAMEEEEEDELLHAWRREEREQEDDKIQQTRTKLDIRCSKGDMIIINTRLWWHSTTLPSMSGKAFCSSKTSDDNNSIIEACVPSVSYARDIYTGENYDKVDNLEKQTHLTNVDGLYAANDIEAGTILFRESEMPDCELHRTRSNPNCELVQLEDGEGAVISCRDIKAGEFFCILESDDSCSEQEFDSDDYVDEGGEEDEDDDDDCDDDNEDDDDDEEVDDDDNNNGEDELEDDDEEVDDDDSNNGEDELEDDYEDEGNDKEG